MEARLVQPLNAFLPMTVIVLGRSIETSSVWPSKQDSPIMVTVYSGAGFVGMVTLDTLPEYPVALTQPLSGR